MARKHWQELIKRFANGRDICNCGEAYYANDGEYIRAGSPKVYHDGKHCKYGCQTNLLIARDELAEKLVSLTQ